MIPLMMQQGYKPNGWLGLIMGTSLYFAFYPAAIDTEAAFMRKIDDVTRGAHAATAHGACLALTDSLCVCTGCEQTSYIQIH